MTPASASPETPAPALPSAGAAPAAPRSPTAPASAPPAPASATTAPASATSASAPAAHPRLRLWLKLVALGAAGYAGAVPYFLHLFGHLPTQPRIPLAAVIALQGIQVLVLVALAAWAGVACAPGAGLDAPWLRGAGRPSFRVVAEAIALGTLASVLVAAVVAALRPHLPAALSEQGATPAVRWIGATSAFYGGLVEEILLRWGILSALVLGAKKLRLDGAAGFWVANLAAALLFGLGHLPAARAIGGPLTAPVVLYVLAGNGIAGLLFGWFFRRRGLEAAMVSHGVADVWLHAVLS